MPDNPLSLEQLFKMDSYWGAANYLSVGQIYLYDNPLLKRPLTLADIKPFKRIRYAGGEQITSDTMVGIV